jgi:methylmalonyl-CoA mutase C-terminal domain/subunit
MSAHRPRILIVKPGLDGHDRGAKVVAFALRDAGCEVIYLGLRSTASEIMSVAVDEDVDVIGASILSGAHLALAAELISERSRYDLDNVPIVVGGIVPPKDIEPLRALGIADVYPAGTPIDDVTDGVKALAESDLASNG